MACGCDIYVLCSNLSGYETWSQRRVLFNDLRILPLYPVDSAIETIRTVAASADRPFLVARDDIWFGNGIGTQAEQLIRELDARFPNWAICGNRGVRWDGNVYDFSYDMRIGGIQTAVCAHPVTCVDDVLLLINPAIFKQHRCFAPAIPSRRSGLLLSLECLQNRSLALVSPRLMAMRKDAKDDCHWQTNALFRNYYRSYFLNHEFMTPDGALDLSDTVDYSYVSEPCRGANQRDILDLYDQAIQRSRESRRPSLTICCRTQFRRVELLDRAVLSFSVCSQHASHLADIHTRIITDQNPAVAGPEMQRLRECYPAADLQCWHHAVRPGRYSRTDLLIGAIERCETDYIWFVDDDDFINPSATVAVARSLVAGAPLMVVGSSVVVKETWDVSVAENIGTGTANPALQLKQACRSSRYDAADIVRVLRGNNFIPICSMVLPVQTLRERLTGAHALGDYNEDYFLLLLMLTAPRLELCILKEDIASISIRGDENTVAQKDRDGWYLSYATFLLEVVNQSNGNSPLLWQLGNILKT